jgi:hypothetical protein
MFGTHVAAENSDTGAVIAATIAGWSCSNADPATVFDGSHTISHLSVGNSYNVCAEPQDSILTPKGVATGLCDATVNSICTTQAVNTNFAPLVRAATPQELLPSSWLCRWMAV